MSETLKLAKALIERPSVTPADEGCQTLVGDRLAKLGFDNETMQIEDVTNLWSRKGREAPLFVFAGHTDVVPAGDRADWQSDPFEPEVRDGMLYGRGAADMKGSIAAMVVATERFIAKHPDHKGSIAYLITSDEEGDAYYGTEAVIKRLEERQEKIDMALVGEPSSTRELGDVIKNGRRGSLQANLTIKGIQGHVAYPHLAENPVHLVAPAIVDLVNEVWDEGNEFFPATNFQISNINSGTGATNVIPGVARLAMGWRFSTEVTPEQLEQRTVAILDRHELDYDIRFELKGMPFLTESGDLLSASLDAIAAVTGRKAELSTGGGTSDGRFIAPTGAQVLELGPINETIHRVNECVSVEDLDQLTEVYEKLLENLLL